MVFNDDLIDYYDWDEPEESERYKRVRKFNVLEERLQQSLLNFLLKY